MRTFGYGIAVGIVLLVAPLASAHYATTFDLALCSANATDIVVVDSDGRVLECWRGELKVGETVGLGLPRLTLANALPWPWLQLRPERALTVLHAPYRRDILAHRNRTLDTLTIAYRGYYISAGGDGPPLIALPITPEWDVVPLRFVLFLRKEGGEQLGTVWMPAAAPPTTELVRGYCDGGFDKSVDRTHYRFTGKGGVDFTTSLVWVEGGRVFALQESVPTAVAVNFEAFKDDMVSRPRPLAAKHALRP